MAVFQPYSKIKKLQWNFILSVILKLTNHTVWLYLKVAEAGEVS